MSLVLWSKLSILIFLFIAELNLVKREFSHLRGVGWSEPYHYYIQQIKYPVRTYPQNRPLLWIINAEWFLWRSRSAMDNLMNLKDFELNPNDRSIEGLAKWRSAVWLVKNPRRRFRWVADLAKRKYAEEKRRKLQVLSRFFFFLFPHFHVCAFTSTVAGKKVRSWIVIRRCSRDSGRQNRLNTVEECRKNLKRNTVTGESGGAVVWNWN